MRVKREENFLNYQHIDDKRRKIAGVNIRNFNKKKIPNQNHFMIYLNNSLKTQKLFKSNTESCKNYKTK